MKKLLKLVFFPIFILIIITNILLIFLNAFDNFKNYRYPFNDFSKVERTMSLSKNHRNLVYIMVDMTTGFDVTSILQDPKNEQLSSNYTGFTNYLNVITNHWGTNAAVANLFGGYDFNVYQKNHGPMEGITFRQYMKKAINVLVSAFGQSLWDISAIGNQYYHYDASKSYWDSNWQTLENDFQQFNLQAINANDVSRMYYYQHPDWYHDLKLPNKVFKKSRNANFMAIEHYLSHQKIVETKTSKLMTIMDESNHVPLTMDENGNFKESSVTVENIYWSAKGFLTRISNFITYLKENGIYDNTMIVINSDHGNNGTGSLPVNNSNFNFKKHPYGDIKKIETKYPGFTRAFPVLLVKPYGETDPINFDDSYLYTNADVLSFIEAYNPAVKFEELNKTSDPRFLKHLNEIENRQDTYLPSYKNDSLWNDDFHHYLTPDSAWGGYSFLVKKSIYEVKNYLVAKDLKDYYHPDDWGNSNYWVPVF